MRIPYVHCLTICGVFPGQERESLFETLGTPTTREGPALTWEFQYEDGPEAHCEVNLAENLYVTGVSGNVLIAPEEDWLVRATPEQVQEHFGEPHAVRPADDQFQEVYLERFEERLLVLVRVDYRDGAMHRISMALTAESPVALNQALEDGGFVL